MKFFTLFVLLACAKLPRDREEIKRHLAKPIEEQVNPFVSDGCSFWPEGTEKNKTKWIRCCIIHDLKYWAGGIKKERAKADDELKSCVEQVQGELVAQMMKEGTELGGSPQFKTNFRWGYGWNYTRGYLKVLKSEAEYLKTISPKRGDDLRAYLDRSKIDPEIEKIDAQIY